MVGLAALFLLVMGCPTDETTSANSRSASGYISSDDPGLMLVGTNLGQFSRLIKTDGTAEYSESNPVPVAPDDVSNNKLTFTFNKKVLGTYATPDKDDNLGRVFKYHSTSGGEKEYVVMRIGGISVSEKTVTISMPTPYDGSSTGSDDGQHFALNDEYKVAFEFLTDDSTYNKLEIIFVIKEAGGAITSAVTGLSIEGQNKVKVGDEYVKYWIDANKAFFLHKGGTIIDHESDNVITTRDENINNAYVFNTYEKRYGGGTTRTDEVFDSLDALISNSRANHQVRIVWNPVDNADTYEVYKSYDQKEWTYIANGATYGDMYEYMLNLATHSIKKDGGEGLYIRVLPTNTYGFSGPAAQTVLVDEIPPVTIDTDDNLTADTFPASSLPSWTGHDHSSAQEGHIVFAGTKNISVNSTSSTSGSLDTEDIVITKVAGSFTLSDLPSSPGGAGTLTLTVDSFLLRDDLPSEAATATKDNTYSMGDGFIGVLDGVDLHLFIGLKCKVNSNSETMDYSGSLITADSITAYVEDHSGNKIISRDENGNSKNSGEIKFREL